MSESTPTSTGTPAVRPARRVDWPAAAGVGFVVLYLAAIAIEPGPDYYKRNGPERTREWLDDTEVGVALLQGFMVALALVLFLVFVHRLLTLLDGAGAVAAPLRGAISTASTFVVAFLVVDVACHLGGIAAEDYSSGYQVSPDAVIAIRGVGDVMFTFALTAAGVLIASLGWLARRHRALPAWLAWASIVVGVVCLFSIPLMGMTAPLFALWALVTGITLLVRRPAA